MIHSFLTRSRRLKSESKPRPFFKGVISAWSSPRGPWTQKWSPSAAGHIGHVVPPLSHTSHASANAGKGYFLISDLPVHSTSLFCAQFCETKMWCRSSAVIQTVTSDFYLITRVALALLGITDQLPNCTDLCLLLQITQVFSDFSEEFADDAGTHGFLTAHPWRVAG